MKAVSFIPDKAWTRSSLDWTLIESPSSSIQDISQLSRLNMGQKHGFFSRSHILDCESWSNFLDIVFQITEKKQRNKSNQFFDLIIDDP